MTVIRELALVALLGWLSVAPLLAQIELESVSRLTARLHGGIYGP